MAIGESGAGCDHERSRAHGMTSDFDYVRSLGLAEAISNRRSMLTQTHVAALATFVEALRASIPGWEFPDFDPLDGGIDADILFLFEKPGPKTSAAASGSGFISRNNDDPTAEATFRFMAEADLSRKRTVTWNIIPGWNGTRQVTPAELREGVASLSTLLPLLAKVQTIVLVGLKAQRARRLVEALGHRVLISAHPSPLVRASQPELWKAIPLAWAQAGSGR